MPRKGEKVYIQSDDVYRQVRHALGSIQQYESACRVRLRDYLFYRVDCAKHIAHLGQAHKANTL